VGRVQQFGARGWVVRIGDVRRVTVPDWLLEEYGLETVSSRLRKLEAATAKVAEPRVELAEQASVKLNRGQPVTRNEAAAFLGLDKRTLQRMEASGRMARCPGLGAVVRYAARDVLRLASAQRKER
jgi:hypothetical protein